MKLLIEDTQSFGFLKNSSLFLKTRKLILPLIESLKLKL
jgi:hypothetical protein